MKVTKEAVLVQEPKHEVRYSLTDLTPREAGVLMTYLTYLIDGHSWDDWPEAEAIYNALEDAGATEVLG